jgi:hypothetical protein
MRLLGRQQRLNGRPHLIRDEPHTTQASISRPQPRLPRPSGCGLVWAASGEGAGRRGLGLPTRDDGPDRLASRFEAKRMRAAEAHERTS